VRWITGTRALRAGPAMTERGLARVSRVIAGLFSAIHLSRVAA
jgi:hypothetical protein